MNLQGRTGSAASSPGHKAWLVLSSALAYVINEWAERRGGGGNSPPKPVQTLKKGWGWGERALRNMFKLCAKPIHFSLVGCTERLNLRASPTKSQIYAVLVSKWPLGMLTFVVGELRALFFHLCGGVSP